jgi:translation initiation factor IF-2
MPPVRVAERYRHVAEREARGRPSTPSAPSSSTTPARSWPRWRPARPRPTRSAAAPCCCRRWPASRGRWPWSRWAPAPGCACSRTATPTTTAGRSWAIRPRRSGWPASPTVRCRSRQRPQRSCGAAASTSPRSTSTTRGRPLAGELRLARPAAPAGPAAGRGGRRPRGPARGGRGRPAGPGRPGGRPGARRRHRGRVPRRRAGLPDAEGPPAVRVADGRAPGGLVLGRRARCPPGPRASAPLDGGARPGGVPARQGA